MAALLGATFLIWRFVPFEERTVAGPQGVVIPGRITAIHQDAAGGATGDEHGELTLRGPGGGMRST